VVGISKNELQSMSTGWKLKTGLSLSCSEMNVLLISWDRLIRLNRLVNIDQEMVVASVQGFVARMSDTHVAQPKPNRKAAPDPLPIAWVDNVKIGVGWSRCLRLSRPQRPTEACGKCSGNCTLSNGRVHQVSPS
jgi:hypothetical protein